MPDSNKRYEYWVYLEENSHTRRVACGTVDSFHDFFGIMETLTEANIYRNTIKLDAVIKERGEVSYDAMTKYYQDKERDGAYDN